LTCLQEAIQTGIKCFVYLKKYQANYEPEIQAQYGELVDRLRNGNPLDFEPLDGASVGTDAVGQFPDEARAPADSGA
jgi:hypothetical protein